MKLKMQASTKLNMILTVGIACLAVCGCVLIAGCSSNTSSTNNGGQKVSEPIVGQWTTQVQRNGKAVDAVLDASEDRTVHFMVLGNTPGIQLIQASINTWEKIGENTYSVKASEGEHTYAYDVSNGTMTDEKEQVFTRLDPYVGIWTGRATDKLGGGNTTTIIKPDGTGLTYAAFDDGTSRVLKMTWVKNNETIYNITLSDGSNATVTVDTEGMSATTSDGFTLVKQHRTEWYLLSVTGTWYNADTNSSAVFNGDGTGFINCGGSISNFKWDYSDIGVFAVTYIDGTLSDGSSAAGKTEQWTYDRNADTFTSEGGVVFSRPTQSIEGLFTLQ